MKSRDLIFIIIISLLGGLLILKLSFSKSTDLTTFALGTNTVTYWSKDANNNIIHISAIDSIGTKTLINSWSIAHKKDVLLLLGNSQTHSINQKKRNEVTYVEMLNKKINNYYVVANTFPNASIQDFLISYKYWKNVLPIKAVAIPLFLDDMRESNGIAYDFYPKLVDMNFNFAEKDILLLKNLNLTFSTLHQQKFALNNSNDFDGISTQDKVEKYLNKFLDSNWDVWNNRKNAQGIMFGKLYELRNTIFNIKATTVRRMIPDKYVDNITALNLIIKDASQNRIKLFLYVAPIRNDVTRPYDPKEYYKFKSEIKNLVNKYPNTIIFKDYDNIIPGKYFGYKESTSLGKQTKELDFMHFQFAGHTILFDSLSHLFFKNNIK